MKRNLERLLLLTLVLAIIGLLAGFLGHVHYAFDTIAHFRLHLAFVAIALCVVTTAAKMRFATYVYLIVAGFSFSTASIGTPLTAKQIDHDPDKPIHSMLHFNLYWQNDKRDFVIERIREINPLLISLSETSERWMQHLDALRDRWPYVAHCPEHGTHGGVMLFSQLTLDRTNDVCGQYGSFMKTTVIGQAGEPMDVVSVHPRWPWPASGPRLYETYEAALLELHDHAIVAGDFNATPWSFVMTRFAQQGNLELVAGIGATWFLQGFPVPLVRMLGLPIDHVLHKGSVDVLSVEILGDWGSDHLPLLVRFQQG